MFNPTFEVTTEQLNRLYAALCAADHNALADTIRHYHPPVLEDTHTQTTGGGCMAYIVELAAGDRKFVVVWTSDDGSDLATDDDYMIGVYWADEFPGEALVLIEILTTANLKPLKGTVKPFHEQVRDLKRPYSEITQEEYERLESGSADFYLTPENQVVTFGTSDGGYTLMPLTEEAANAVLAKQ